MHNSLQELLEKVNGIKEDMIKDKYFTEADCEEQEVVDLKQYKSAQAMIEYLTKFSPKLLNIVDGFDVYLVSVKEVCSDLNACDVVLQVMKDRNFLKVF